jgi:hypothetical protein
MLHLANEEQAAGQLRLATCLTDRFVDWPNIQRLAQARPYDEVVCRFADSRGFADSRIPTRVHFTDSYHGFRPGFIWRILRVPDSDQGSFRIPTPGSFGAFCAHLETLLATAAVARRVAIVRMSDEPDKCFAVFAYLAAARATHC